jgi:thiamine biosynthesis lipoprotein
MFRFIGSVWLTALLAVGCARTPSVLELSGPTMGTTYSVKVVNAPARMDAAALRLAIEEVLALIDRQMSGYRNDSEISAFNRSRSIEWFPVSPQLAQLVGRSLDVSAESGGALDITVAPLVNLWGMGPQGERADLPTQHEIDQVRANVGYLHLSARAAPPALRKALPELSVDLNAVAPGYAVDALAERFMQAGIENFMIDIGGEVRARGVNAQGGPWRIAVEKPVDRAAEPFAILELPDIAVTTSGEYRRFIVRDAHRYSHTMDPRNGRPVEHALASVVVIAPSAFEADAWATAFNVLGEEAGYRLAQRREMPVLFIVEGADGLESRMTAAFERYLVVAPQ